MFVMSDPVAHDDFPLAYLISIRCYGTWLPGDERGWVDPDHNDFGTPYRPPQRGLAQSTVKNLTQDPYSLDAQRRSLVLDAIIKVCEHREYTLEAAHVLDNHLHTVVRAKVKPEPIMNAFKSYASRALNESNLDTDDRKRWSRHGSTRWLWKIEEVERAIQYTLDEQGQRMAWYERPM